MIAKDKAYVEPIIISLELVNPSLPKEFRVGCVTPLLDEFGIYICCHGTCFNMTGDTEFRIKTYVCGGCRNARYCSRECQAADWKFHKNDCI